ncbi:hypothetical protein ACFL3S_09005 [Gemmatimonadota bacterium]
MRPSLTALMALGILLGATLPQQARGQEGTREPVAHDQVISGNPLILLAGWFNAEYERKLSNTTTAGFGGGWISLDGGDDDYTSLNGFLRYYPQGAALTGFYLGGRLGIHRVDTEDESASVFGLGVDLGYSWLLGPSRAFYVGLGLGATRLFGGDLEDASPTIPVIRLINIGIAF